MDESAVDAALEGVGAADALNDSVVNRLACVLDLVDASGESDGLAGAFGGATEFELERCGLVVDSPADLALAANETFDVRPHGEKHFVLADEVLREDGVNGIAGLRGVGGDG
jgi:hypothetical protein